MTHPYSHHSEQGFTLVETLVAITILLLVITGPLTISMATARSTDFASEQVVAFFLAQEGVELAQKARDEIMLPGVASEVNHWGDFADDATGADYVDCFESDGCGLEINTNVNGTLKVPVDCNGGACRLYYSSDGAVRSRYTHTSMNNIQTPYTRTIKFEKGSDVFDVKVVSTVTWRTGNLRKNQEVTVETTLFDIYDN